MRVAAKGAEASEFFDLRTWRRFIRADEFDQASTYVETVLHEHGVDAVRSLRSAYAELSVDAGWMLLWDVPSGLEGDVGAAIEDFLWDIYRDPSCPYGHRGMALRMLAARRVAGVEPLLVLELTARSEERRSLALRLLAEQGTPDCVGAVLERVRTLLKRPARVGMTHKRLQMEVLFGVVAVFRCGDAGQLAALARLLRRGVANLAPEERAWLREFWPACLDQPEDAPVPEPNVSRVLEWTRGQVRVDWPESVADLHLYARPEWDVDPSCVNRA